MYSPFSEIQGRIDVVRLKLEEIHDEFTRISASNFDPIHMPALSNFSRTQGTPDQVADILYNDAPKDEVFYQLSMVNFCLLQMKAANELIQLQNCYKVNLTGKERRALEDTIDNDARKFADLIDNAGALREQRKKPGLPIPLDETSYKETFIKLLQTNTDVEQGKISWRYQYASKPADILNHIFRHRWEAMTHSLGAIEHLEERIDGNLADYILIRTARDENIMSEGPFLQQLEDEKRDFCARMLPQAQASLNLVQEFTSSLQEMGPRGFVYRQFEVERYAPLSIKGLPQITP